jgi:fibronectin-binding autotransporter adhesin
MKKLFFATLRFRDFIPGASVCLAVLTVANPLSTRADTFLPTSGTASWNLQANWDTNMVPNAVGASVFFGNGTANRTIQTDSGATGFTVGSISFDVPSSATNSITTGTGGSKLILDNGGNGVTITTSGFGSGNNTISVPLVLNELVTGQVDQTTASSAAGSLNLTATITGTGGFIKQGDGLATFGTGAKSYTGPTVLNGGRIRISSAARPTSTSSFTINDGGQLDLIPATAGGPQTFPFGSGPLNLNGAGPTSGSFAAFPGAIRNDRGGGSAGIFQPTITNPVVLESNTLIHVEAIAGTGSNLVPDGFLTLSGNISGPGSLSLTAPGVSDADQGTLFLTGINTYEGGTFVNGGIINVNSDAALGAPASPLQLNGTFFGVNYLRAMLRASGTISTTARTLVLGQFGNNVGGTIDTNGNNVTFDAGSAITGTTLTKIGDGKLTIAGDQSYDTLDTEGGRTDVASAVGTGSSAIIANAETNISATQTLSSLTIGSAGKVTLSAALPLSPPVVAAETNASNSAESHPSSEHGAEPPVSFAQVIPEPGSTALLLSAVGVLFAMRRRMRA